MVNCHHNHHNQEYKDQQVHNYHHDHVPEMHHDHMLKTYYDLLGYHDYLLKVHQKNHHNHNDHHDS